MSSTELKSLTHYTLSTGRSQSPSLCFNWWTKSWFIFFQTFGLAHGLTILMRKTEEQNWWDLGSWACKVPSANRGCSQWHLSVDWKMCMCKLHCPRSGLKPLQESLPHGITLMSTDNNFKWSRALTRIHWENVVTASQLQLFVTTRVLPSPENRVDRRALCLSLSHCNLDTAWS